jgi:hypothetical protein
MHYNFARIHQTLRVSPAMEAGFSDHAWSIKEIVGRLDSRERQRENHPLAKRARELFSSTGFSRRVQPTLLLCEPRRTHRPERLARLAQHGQRILRGPDQPSLERADQGVVEEALGLGADGLRVSARAASLPASSVTPRAAGRAPGSRAGARRAARGGRRRARRAHHSWRRPR